MLYVQNCTSFGNIYRKLIPMFNTHLIHWIFNIFEILPRHQLSHIHVSDSRSRGVILGVRDRSQNTDYDT